MLKISLDKQQITGWKMLLFVSIGRSILSQYDKRGLTTTPMGKRHHTGKPGSTPQPPEIALIH